MHKAKTNAVRILESAHIAYECVEYAHEEGVAVDGKTVAALLKEAEEQVFKTLVTRSGRQGFFVFVIPVTGELDLKAAARAVGEKSLEMLPVADLLKTTGYVRGGCSPVGMKKAFPTVIDSSAAEQPYIYVSAGRIGLQMRISPQDLAMLIKAPFRKITQEQPGKST